MSILNALAAVANAAAAYFKFKSISESYRLSRRIEADNAADENEIARLRALPDTGSHMLADRLQQRIVRAQGWLGHLPTPNPGPESGATGANGGGDIHTAN
jgi:hypothetical protein